MKGRAPLTWSRFRFPQSLVKYAATLALLALCAYAADFLSIDLDRLPGMLGRMGATLSSRYLPPNVGHILHRDYLTAVFQTLEMSYLATVLGLALAIPLAWFGSHNMTPSRRILYPLARLAVTGARSVHEMIWTILFVAILGFGMLPGTLALILFCIGFAGKLFAEAIEAVDQGQVEAMRATGANPLQVFVFGVLPQVRVAWAGIAIYTWDAVFRAATIVGFFGAGGMGSYLRESVQLIASRDVAAILLSIIVVVLVLELASAWLRNTIAKAVA
ncbi:MAG TPA: phosphonate ABC transporter, permease protein PhnE [Burkholderiales bacterium]